MTGVTQALKSGRRWRVDTEDLPMCRQAGYLEQSLPEELGNGSSKFFQLDADLNYIETCYTPGIDLAIASRMESPHARLVVTLSLQGRSRFDGAHGDEVLFDAGITTITAFSASVGERHYQAGQAVTQLRFAVNRRWLENYCGMQVAETLFNGGGVRTVACRPMAPQTAIAAQQLLGGQAPHAMQPLFRHGQALAILAAELCPLCESQGRSEERFNRRDEAVALAARDILQREFKSPPSVQALAQRVGTNPFKLKQLFHHYFHTTPYGFLLDVRMHTAYRLLESTRCPVSAAAEFVGYGHASNFSAAFTKYFGVPPKRV
ncbi:MAG: helix-turn-helix transcriptional regulator [Gammaproteobacteria bacterium]